MAALDMEGVHNRNIIPTRKKKGRVGYIEHSFETKEGKPIRIRT